MLGIKHAHLLKRTLLSKLTLLTAVRIVMKNGIVNVINERMNLQILSNFEVLQSVDLMNKFVVLETSTCQTNHPNTKFRQNDCKMILFVFTAFSPKILLQVQTPSFKLSMVIGSKLKMLEMRKLEFFQIRNVPTFIQET